MKLTATNNSFITSSDETSDFQISANGTAFQILSSGLYSNKIKAVIRELTCNAYDAHVMVGKKETPIEVFLPTVENLIFKVKDYGPGLSHENILSLYTTYFSSDKRNNNEQIGGLGLGSKSPFAYTNTFNVQSTHNGITRIYSCNIKADGSPSITKLSEEETSNTSGLEVSMSVNRQDIYKFYDEAKNVLKWFDVTPIFNIELEVVKWNSKLLFKNEAFYIEDNYNQYTFVRMGNVAYPVDLNSISSDLPEDVYKLVSSLNLIVNSPIGFLQVAASREALQYDPQTKKNLVLLLTHAANMILTQWASYLYNPSKWEAIKNFLDFKSSVLSRIHHRLNEDALWSLLDKHIDRNKVDKDVYLRAKKFNSKTMSYPSSVDENDLNIFVYPKDNTGKKVINGGHISVGDSYQVPDVYVSDKTKIIVVDELNYNDKLNAWRNTNHKPSVILISGNKSKLNEMTQKANEISRHLFDLPVVLLSELNLNLNVTQKTKNKSVYVEIDDREVTLVNFKTDNKAVVKLSSLSDKMKYYMIKDTKSKNGDYFKEDVGSSTIWTEYELEKLSSAMNYLKDELKDAPEGVILVNPVDVARLKLIERNFSLFTPALIETMKLKDNLPAIIKWSKVQRQTITKMNYYNSGMCEYEGGWVSALTELYKKSHWSAKLDPIFKTNPELLKMVNIRKGYVNEKVYNFYASMSSNFKELSLPDHYTSSYFQKWFDENYPMAKYIQFKMFSDANTTQSVERALPFLQGVLK